MKGVLLDSVSSKVLCRISKINIMIMSNPLVDALRAGTMKSTCPMIFSRILCPTDFSEFSIKTIAFDSTMNRVGEIILLHVVQESGPDNEAARTAEFRIRGLCDEPTLLGIRSRSIVRDGKTWNRDSPDSRRTGRIPHLDEISCKRLSPRLLFWQHGA